MPEFTVLIADDDPLVRELVVGRLHGQAQTVQAHDGAAAWELIRRQTFDLVIVDLSMPGLSGFEVIQRMRARFDTRTTPILVVTSHGDQFVLKSAMDMGATSFLTKPIKWSAFDTQVRAALGQIKSDRAMQSLRPLQSPNLTPLSRLRSR